MESNSNLNLDNLNVSLTPDNGHKNLNIEPVPYTFTKVENGKKTIIDTLTFAPPRWMLLDHTIAVIWLMFSSNALLHQLNINDLKLAHEFLKEIKNSKGENPPDVKTCLKEIQDRLIYFYARLKNFNEEYDKDSVAGNEKTNSSKFYCKQVDKMSIMTSLSPSKTNAKLEHPLLQGQSFSDISTATSLSQIDEVNYSKKSFPLTSKTSNIFEYIESLDDNEIKKYFLRFFEEKNNDETSQNRPGTKSLSPPKKSTAPKLSFTEKVCVNDNVGSLKEAVPKEVHCVAEMESLKYRKSMKLQDVNGQEAAYANLNAEIKRMTINPEKNKIIDFEKWRKEKIIQYRNDLSILNSSEK